MRKHLSLVGAVGDRLQTAWHALVQAFAGASLHVCCVLRENIFDLLLSRGICQNAFSWTSMPLGRVET